MTDYGWLGAPSLRECVQRLEVAHHRALAVAEQCRLASTVTDGMRLTFDKKEWETGNAQPTLDWKGVEKPHSFFTITHAASECIHHARCALDHLVFNLSRLDSGQVNERTAFPIVKLQQRWGDEARSKLKGITPEHRDMIKSYQPFNGGSWLADFNDLSNGDKHRSIVPANNQYDFKVAAGQEVVECADDPSRVEYKEIRIRSSVTFTDTELEVGSTLLDWHRRISLIVGDFIPIFGNERNIIVNE